MRWTKWLLAAVVAAALGFPALFTYYVSTASAVGLMSCIKVPPFPGGSWACKKAMYAFHPTQEEVAELNEMGAAVWLLSLSEEESRSLLKHFVAAGLDVNAIDQRPNTLGWTSMHIAVSEHDVKAVRLLLEAGAKVDLEKGRKPSPRDILQSHLAKQPNDPALIEIQKMFSTAAP